ncbi:MAG: SDR family oxidoreductase [Alphaproteobacteria bacterium]|nr:SDR family oxidoreductase [Alphaproteobacteria bacterium]
MSFSGSSVWITGGGSGLGRAMAVEFARQGASVAVSGRREDRLAETVAAVEAAGGRGLAVPCDVTQDADLEAAVAAVVGAFGKLDVAVANAGFGVAGRFETLTRDDWRRQLDLNVVSAAMTAKLALPELEKTQGRIALVGSVAAFLPLPKNAPYCASKAAIGILGRTLSAELAPKGVTCTTIHPGFVESEIALVDNDGNFDETRVDKRPANLMWKAEDAARVMVWAIAKRKVEHTFTGHGKAGVFVGRHLPWLVQRFVTARR